jgi:phosphoglycerate kinase
MIETKKLPLLRLNQEEIKNKDVILRVDFNVDLKKGKVLDKYRIIAVKDTINILKKAKKVIILSHLKENLSFKKLLPEIEKILNIKINFLKDFNSPLKEKFNFLENLRKWKEEKEADLSFAKKLASFGEIFVFDAFSVAHRKHSSVYWLPKILPTYYGLNFEKEINLLNKFLKSKHLTLILGGAKISTKLPLIKKFQSKAELIILGGGLTNTFYKAKGFEMGDSLVENDILDEVKKLPVKKILLPFDFIVLNKKKILKNKFLGEINKGDIIYDIGPESLKVILDELKKAKNIIWNGPLGYIENEKFKIGTLTLAKFLIKLKRKNILVGGGDTLGFLEKEKLIKKFKNISTGGGAMLYYLAEEKLWAVK